MENIKKLTLEDAQKLFEYIDKIKGDDEGAHAKEDYLREWFVECCSEGLYTRKEMIAVGKIVLSTKDLDFARWYA